MTEKAVVSKIKEDLVEIREKVNALIALIEEVYPNA